MDATLQERVRALETRVEEMSIELGNHKQVITTLHYYLKMARDRINANEPVDEVWKSVAAQSGHATTMTL